MNVHRQIIDAEKAPTAVGPYSHAVRAGNLLFCSGQIPLDPETNTIVADNVADQAVQCLKNLTAVCEAAGAKLADAAKVGIFLTDMADFEAVNTIYEEYFSETMPARATIAVAGLPKGALVEIDAVVVLPA